MKMIRKVVAISVFVLSNWYVFIGASKVFDDKAALQLEVAKYCSDPTSYDVTEYGKIEAWDVSQITDMSVLFYDEETCNPNISAWHVSQVTDFYGMFDQATSFNQNIGGWDVSSATEFRGTFRRATSFNQNVGGWDVSSATTFYSMFQLATSFNQNIEGWDISSGTEFRYMFYGATSFNQNIEGWDVASGTNFDYMFSKATSFHQDLTKWPLSAQESNYFCTGARCDDAPSTITSPTSVNTHAPPTLTPTTSSNNNDPPTSISTSSVNDDDLSATTGGAPHWIDELFVVAVLTFVILFVVYVYKRYYIDKRSTTSMHKIIDNSEGDDSGLIQEMVGIS